MLCSHTFVHCLILRLFLLSLSSFYFFTQFFSGCPDQENLSENFTKRTETFRDILCLKFLFFKPFNVLHTPRKTLLSKIPYILVKNRLCLPDHHSVKIYTSPVFAWASARAIFAQIFPFSPAKQFSTAMPWRDLQRNFCVIGSLTSKSISMQKKAEVHCWSSLEELPLTLLVCFFF